jgi:hypothetical protein
MSHCNSLAFWPPPSAPSICTNVCKQLPGSGAHRTRTLPRSPALRSPSGSPAGLKALVVIVARTARPQLYLSSHHNHSLAKAPRPSAASRKTEERTNHCNQGQASPRPDVPLPDEDIQGRWDPVCPLAPSGPHPCSGIPKARRSPRQP